MGITYWVYFLTADGAAEATLRLGEAGFVVRPETDQAPAGAPFGIEASAEDDADADADARLDSVIADIPHDPFVVWQRTQFAGFTRRSD